MKFEPMSDNQEKQANDSRQDTSGNQEALVSAVSMPSCELFEGGLGI
jgi:hypothetical protein